MYRNIKILLVICRKNICEMPSVYVRAELRSVLMTERGDSSTTLDCPVFINRARQVCAFHLPLNCGEAVERWQLHFLGIILDIGKIFF